MGIGSVFLLSVPLCMKWALDALASGEATWWGVLAPAAGLMVILHLAYGVFTYWRGRLAAEASEGIVARLRHELFAQLERIPCEVHDQLETGDIVQRCSSDVETLRVFLSSQIVEVARVSMFLLIAIPIMLWHDTRMTAISLCLTPVIVIFAAVFFRKVRRLFLQVDEAEGQLTTVVQENLTGIRVVRAFAQQAFEIDKFRERNSTFRDREYRLFIALCNYWSLSDVLVFSQLGIILVGGSVWVLEGSLSVGTWVLFFWLMRTIIWPVRQIGRVLSEAGKATVAIGRIEEVLQMSDEHEGEASRDAAGPIEVGDIEFRDVTFRYGGDAGEAPPALRDFSLTVRSGETIALMGAPGSGKSTAIRLLLRLYDYQHGTITLAGRELRDLPRAAVREAFGVVLQDPFLYSKTIGENIALGRADASQEDLEAAAHAADIHRNVVDFPDKYDTSVGERGVTLSGGQRQRLAIARALLKDPEVLVLDDSLSAVDTKTEAEILRALARRRGSRTTILITHRLSSTRLADRIVVMADGQVDQAGDHATLAAESGVYRRLCQIQGTLDAQIAADQAIARGGGGDAVCESPEQDWGTPS